MRLGLSPAAASAPTGVFNQRFEALFPPRWSFGSRGLLCSPAVPPPLSTCKCGASSHLLVGSASCSLACPAPQSTTSLDPPAAALSGVLSARLPISAPPTSLDECLFFMSLVSDFLAVRFSVSSGCARRRSVSTYAAILVLSSFYFLKILFICFQRVEKGGRKRGRETSMCSCLLRAPTGDLA